jgi:hypothetical protein
MKAPFKTPVTVQGGKLFDADSNEIFPSAETDAFIRAAINYHTVLIETLRKLTVELPEDAYMEEYLALFSKATAVFELAEEGKP